MQGNRKDFWSGIMFAVVGLFFVVFAQEHSLGSASRMGPAYFPTLLGGILAVMGCLIAIKSFFTRCSPEEGHIGRFHWRVLGLILGAVLVFSLLLNFLGLMLSLAAMIIIAGLADTEFRWKETFVLILVLDGLSWLVFVYAIGMPVTVWPTFIG